MGEVCDELMRGPYSHKHIDCDTGIKLPRLTDSMKKYNQTNRCYCFKIEDISSGSVEFDLRVNHRSVDANNQVS